MIIYLGAYFFVPDKSQRTRHCEKRSVEATRRPSRYDNKGSGLIHRYAVRKDGKQIFTKSLKMNHWYHCSGETTILTLYIQPGAKHNQICGLHNGALKIKLATPAIEGRANEALLQFIAKLFKVPQRHVELRKGNKSRHKIVAINGSSINPEDMLLNHQA